MAGPVRQGKHASLAGMARAYLLYCDCTRKAGEKRSIVAAVTGGETDNLMVGRNGVFCDHKGNDWDATVTRIVDNPISIRQAFWSPYRSFIRMIEAQVAKRATAADEEAKKKLEVAATETAHIDNGRGVVPQEASGAQKDRRGHRGRYRCGRGRDRYVSDEHRGHV